MAFAITAVASTAADSRLLDAVKNQDQKTATSTRPARGHSTEDTSYTATLETCKRLIAEDKFSEAQKRCTFAVTLAGTLPAKAWHERSVAYSMRGSAELSVNDADDAAEDFRKALDIDEKNLKSRDAALATDYAHLGRAQFELGGFEDLNFANESFQTAVEILEENMLNYPARRSEYRHSIKEILLDFAKVKRALGQESLAIAFEQQSKSIR